MVDARFPAEAETMLRDVERGSNPWGKPQTERADWAEGLDVRVLEPGDPAARGALLGRLRGRVRRARARPRRSRPRSSSSPRGSTSRSSARASRAPAIPPAATGNEYVFQSFAAGERRDAERRGRDEDRRELPPLLQHARERVPGLRRATTRSCTTRSCSPTSCATGRLSPVARQHDDHLSRLLLPRPSQRRARCPARDRRADWQAARDGAEREAHLLLRRRRRAHVDGGARQPDQRGTRP